MKGLELSEMYFREVGLPALRDKFGNLIGKMDFGLVGEGSECFGYDDEFSRDHDWGPGFCIWLDSSNYAAFGNQVSEVYETLPRVYKGFGPRSTTQLSGKRVGVFEVNAFYKQFVGNNQPPNNNYKWLTLPENYLATATNGKVFLDTQGEFTRIREALLQFYPEDIRLKKIAARCMSAGQAGQYNFNRSIKRNELYAAEYAQMKFCADILSMVFLLNYRYAPFYKWVHHASKNLPVLGSYFHNNIINLLKEHDYKKKTDLIESLSQTLINEMVNQEICERKSDYLPDYGPIIQARIQDQDLRKISVLIG